jgi:uncharacterized membrane protein YoaK (UPF0700 family)
MLQAKGAERQYLHDLKVASMLSFAAGSVNSASFFAFDVLTTNVTGHVALMANDVVAYNWEQAQMKFLWMFLFLFGAFSSAMLVSLVGKKNQRYSHTLPLLIEMGILIFVTIYGNEYYDYSKLNTQLLAGGLLFAMGLQNATVSLVSGFVVRTTHLTGLFTDLGIETSKLIFPEDKAALRKTKRKLTLQLTIAFFFFFGAVVGGFLFANYLFYAFLIAAGIIFTAILFDVLDFQKEIQRKKKEKNTLAEERPIGGGIQLSEGTDVQATGA